MATIALYAGKINEMPGLINSIRKSVMDYKLELSAMRTKSLQINQSICDLSSVISSIQAASQTQEEKQDSLDMLNQSLEYFAEDAVRIDDEVSDLVRQRKDNFYEQYNYLKPVSEMNDWEKICNKCAKAGEWCREHWKEIVITIFIVIGAVLAIVAVVCTGGMALVPVLTAILTAFGVSAGLATTIATVASLTIAGIAIFSTLVSSTLNIIGTWGNYSDNPTFKAWQTVMNWISAISNGFYSIGSIYNGFKGISNTSLREYSKAWLKNPEFRNAISGADRYRFALKPDTSTFWSGISDDGMSNGDLIASNCADKMGRTTLESTLTSDGIDMPKWNFSDPSSINAWNSASSSYAMNSSGGVNALLRQSVRPTSVWNVFERTLLNINPRVTGITIFTPATVNVYPRIVQLNSFFMGTFNSIFQTAPLLNDKK